MVFSSNIFLFAFLPLFLAGYYVTPYRWRSAFILAGSYVFYAWWRLDALPLLAGVTLVSYLIALRIEATTGPARRNWLALGITLNLAGLGYFKYANLGVNTLNAILMTARVAPLAWRDVLLPIGLSFYIFHAISYLVDIYKKEAAPARNLVDFAAFIALFPHLVAGPVLRYHLLAQQFRSRSHTLEKFSRGATRFAMGFSKKVLIADTVAPLANAVFAAPLPGFSDAWIGALAYTAQIFFDFSGYSDMAIGLALMLGFVFPENFDDPYISRSITEFWRRWHMSLSAWLREYLYIPLGGNRRGRARTFINLFLTMLLGGLWHGANWTFVAWGAWHGFWLALERLRREALPPGEHRELPAWVTIPRTLLLVVIGWVIFRAPGAREAWHVLSGMAGLRGWSNPNVAWAFTRDRLLVLALAGVLAYAAPAWKAVTAHLGAPGAYRARWLDLLVVPL
ncbi:MAG TPA: MBOAT family protein, partial [Deinococcales bacterium]|nr:MBOAT family protein [Deinococcales bacterium]